jgi:hypothetical protein
VLDTAVFQGLPGQGNVEQLDVNEKYIFRMSKPLRCCRFLLSYPIRVTKGAELAYTSSARLVLSSLSWQDEPS